MKGHHLILGTLVDYLTGNVLDDTLDERYRQTLARFLVEKKNYLKEDIVSRQHIVFSAGENKAGLFIDFTISLSSIVGMIVKYGPGSIVTRHRSALALSRIMTTYQIPIVVVTNGQTADILDGESGKILSSGLDRIPTKENLTEIIKSHNISKISAKRFEMESRVLYAYEVDGACPCDDTICRL